MPTAITTKWPRPKSEDEWEDMVLDAMRVRWRDPNACRNGRRGQRQDGVDIFGNSIAGPVGAQAKNKEQVTEKEALQEIAEAENFRPALKEYFFVIGGPRDATFQEFSRILSRNRVARGLFSVHAIFFDDVIHEISSDKALVLKYWGSFFHDLVAALRTGLDGPILDPNSALNKIMELEQYKVMTAYFDALCEPEFNLTVVIEHEPNLCAPAGDIRRFWRMAIGESYPDRNVYVHRVAIAVEGKEVRIWRVQDNTWLTLDEWARLKL
jgi:hypothetical protein